MRSSACGASGWREGPSPNPGSYGSRSITSDNGCNGEGTPFSTAEGYTNDWWSKLRDQNGFVSNIYIDDPAARLPGVPDCP